MEIEHCDTWGLNSDRQECLNEWQLTRSWKKKELHHPEREQTKQQLHKNCIYANLCRQMQILEKILYCNSKYNTAHHSWED